MMNMITGFGMLMVTVIFIHFALLTPQNEGMTVMPSPKTIINHELT